MNQNPTEGKYCYCEPDLPGQCRFRTPPNKGQRQGAHTTNSHDNKGFSEIPLNLLLCGGRELGRIEEFTAVFTLYCLVLNLFSAKGTLLHYSSFLVERSAFRRAVKRRLERFVGPCFIRLLCPHLRASGATDEGACK